MDKEYNITKNISFKQRIYYSNNISTLFKHFIQFVIFLMEFEPIIDCLEVADYQKCNFWLFFNSTDLFLSYGEETLINKKDINIAWHSKLTRDMPYS